MSTKKIKKVLAILVNGIFFTAFLFAFTQKVQADTFIVYPASDTYVDSSYPDTNFNSRPYLLVKDYEDHWACSYIKFQHIPEPSAGLVLKSATLHLDIIGRMGDSPAHWHVAPASGNWEAATLTANNRPGSLTNPQYTSDPTIDTSEDRVGIDLTQIVKGWQSGELDFNKGVVLCDRIGGNRSLVTIKKQNSPPPFTPFMSVVYDTPPGEGGLDEPGPTHTPTPTLTPTATLTPTLIPTDTPTPSNTPSPTLETEATTEPTTFPTDTNMTPTDTVETENTSSPAPTVAGSQDEKNNQINSFIYLLIIAILLVAMATLLILFLRKKKQQTPLSNTKTSSHSRKT